MNTLFRGMAQQYYNSFAQRVVLICSEGGTHLLRGWYSFAQRVVLICIEGGTHLLRGWYSFAQRVVLICSEGGTHLLRGWYSFSLQLKNPIKHFPPNYYEFMTHFLYSCEAPTPPPNLYRNTSLSSN